MNKEDKATQREHVRKQESGTVIVGKFFLLGAVFSFLVVNILKNNRIAFTGTSYWFAFGFAAAVFIMGAIKLYQARKIEAFLNSEIDNGRVVMVEKKQLDDMLDELNRLQALSAKYGIEVEQMKSETKDNLKKLNEDVSQNTGSGKAA